MPVKVINPWSNPWVFYLLSWNSLLKPYLYSVKNIWYSRKYICIQSKIFTSNEKYFYSILLFLCLIKNHTRTLFQNQVSYSEYFLSFTNIQLTV